MCCTGGGLCYIAWNSVNFDAIIGHLSSADLKLSTFYNRFRSRSRRCSHYRPDWSRYRVSLELLLHPPPPPPPLPDPARYHRTNYPFSTALRFGALRDFFETLEFYTRSSILSIPACQLGRENFSRHSPFMIENDINFWIGFESSSRYREVLE